MRILPRQPCATRASGGCGMSARHSTVTARAPREYICLRPLRLGQTETIIVPIQSQQNPCWPSPTEFKPVKCNHRSDTATASSTANIFISNIQDNLDHDGSSGGMYRSSDLSHVLRYSGLCASDWLDTYSNVNLHVRRRLRSS